MVLGDPLLVVGLLARVLDELEVRYAVGGSVASSIYGHPRATQDVDLVAALYLRHVDPLVNRLQDTFYIDKGMIEDALARRASFNVVHLGTMFKADIFCATRDPWQQKELERARLERIETSNGTPLCQRSCRMV